jgi:hypothetical protein
MKSDRARMEEVKYMGEVIQSRADMSAKNSQGRSRDDGDDGDDGDI